MPDALSDVDADAVSDKASDKASDADADVDADAVSDVDAEHLPSTGRGVGLGGCWSRAHRSVAEGQRRCMRPGCFLLDEAWSADRRVPEGTRRMSVLEGPGDQGSWGCWSLSRDQLLLVSQRLRSPSRCAPVGLLRVSRRGDTGPAGSWALLALVAATLPRVIPASWLSAGEAGSLSETVRQHRGAWRDPS